MAHLDRFGEETDPDAGDHLCVDGWLLIDAGGRPKPCPRCRPHLVRRHDAPATPAGGYRVRRPAATESR